MFDVGALVAGQHRIERHLGEGGMASVFEAIDTRTGARVALKAMHPHLLADHPEAVERFRLEGRLLQRLGSPQRHPAVIYALQVIDQPKLQALVMPLIPDGLGLDAWLRDRGPMPPQQAIALALATLDGLTFIHAHDILHRDLKPSNILLRPDGLGGFAPVIADLGIARDLTAQADLLASHPSATDPDSPDALGSPPYMAPELFDSAHEASPASDLYALGATLFELIAGRPPFTVESVAAHVLRISTQPPPPLTDAQPAAPPWLSKVIAAAMAPDPAERFPSAADFALALRTEGGSCAPLLDDDPTQITADYRVEGCIGRGPVATVFACADVNLQVPVALKRLRGLDPGRRARFVAEAKAQAALHQGRPHPNVAAIRHVIANPDCFALVVERVKGAPWDTFWAARSPSLPLALSLGAQIADALAYAHQRGVLHHNLKPSNVLITDTPDGPRAKLTDFGMHAVHGDTPKARIATARRVGALAFLPPEAASANAWSPAGDLYMVGALLLHAILGRLPPTALDAQGHPAPLSGGLTPAQRALPDLPEQVADLLRTCLAASPADRPADAASLRDALTASLPVAAAAEAASASPAITPRKRATAIWIAAAALTLTAAVAVALLLARSQDPTPAPSPPLTPTTSAEPPPPPTPPPMTDEAFMAHISALQAEHQQAVFSECVAKLLSDPTHQATVRALNLTRAETDLLLSISPDGHLDDLAITRDDLAPIGMGTCIATLARTWAYPAPQKPMRVTMPWPLDL